MPECAAEHPELSPEQDAMAVAVTIAAIRNRRNEERTGTTVRRRRRSERRAPPDEQAEQRRSTMTRIF